MSGDSNRNGDPAEAPFAPSFKYFENRSCEYWPCHELERINCLFCFCPLYPADCGGNWTLTETGVKDCSACAVPHGAGGYEYVMKRLSRLSAEVGDEWL